MPGREDELFRRPATRQFRGGLEIMWRARNGERGSFRVNMSPDVIFGSQPCRVGDVVTAG